jgi:hypothetical protein
MAADREGDAIYEELAPALRQQPRLLQILLLPSLFTKEIEHLTLRRPEADLKALNQRESAASLIEVGKSLVALFCMEKPVVAQASCKVHELFEALFRQIFWISLGSFYRNVVALSERFYSLSKAKAVVLHEKCNGIAMSATAKAVKVSVAALDRERGRSLFMKRAASLEGCSRALQGHVGVDEIDEIHTLTERL